MFTCRGRQGAVESNKEGSGSSGPFFIISFVIFWFTQGKKIEMRLMSELTSCRRGAGDGVTGGTDNAR